MKDNENGQPLIHEDVGQWRIWMLLTTSDGMNFLNVEIVV